MEDIIKTLNEIKNMLKMLGYEIDLHDNEIPLYKHILITRDSMKAGSIIIKDKNLYWLNENGELLANEKINGIRFNQIPKKNVKTVINITINDDKFKCNCYNLIKKNYVGLENKKIKLKFHPEYMNITLKEDNFTIYYPNRLDTSNKHSDKLNNIFGYDVISSIESYYANNKTKVKK